MKTNAWNLDVLKMLIQEEQHLRSVFEDRVAYHTKLLLAIMGVVGAGIFNAHNRLQFILLSVGCAVAAWIAISAPTAVKRLNIHFIETIRIRENCEKLLGLRADNVQGQSHFKAEERNQTDDFLQSIYELSWIPGDAKSHDKISENVGAYYREAKKRFHVLFVITGIFGLILLLVAFIAY